MPFVKAGYSLMHFSSSDVNKIIGNYGHGFNVGTGVVYSPFESVFASLEYNYHHLFYPSNNVKVEGVTVGKITDLTFNAHIVKATIGVKFNIDDLI
jgi:opacity protein-like surface antigen